MNVALTFMSPQGEDVNDQPTEEWDKMTQQRQDEIRAGIRLAAVIADTQRATLRGRLARASAPSARALEALRHSGI